MRKTLLMTTAAAALILSGSFAGAQDMKGGQGASSGGATRAPAAQQNAPAEKMAPSMNAGHGAQTTGQRASDSNKMGRHSQTTGQGSSGSKEMNAGPNEKSGAKVRDRNDTKTTGQASESRSKAKEADETKSKTNAREERNGKARNAREKDHNGRQGAAANERKSKDHNKASASGRNKENATTGQGAAGSRAKLTTQQRTKITTVIKERHVRPVEHVNFNISIGVRVPHTVHLYPLPTEVISIYPAWRGFEFILVGDRIVVIDPHTFEIVEVIVA